MVSMEIEVVIGRQAGIGLSHLLLQFEGSELLLVVLMQFLRDCQEVERVCFARYLNQGCRVIALLGNY
jgi:hypothetical protein